MRNQKNVRGRKEIPEDAVRVDDVVAFLEKQNDP
jgi:hypothetical protein